MIISFIHKSSSYLHRLWYLGLKLWGKTHYLGGIQFKGNDKREKKEKNVRKKEAYVNQLFQQAQGT